MSKTQKTALIIAGAVLLSLAAPFILFAGIFAASLIGDAMITQKDVEEYGKKMQPKTGIVFPVEGRRDVERERRVATCMAAHLDVVHIHVGHPIDGSKMQ